MPVDEYAVTDKNGLAKFENVLISGDTPYVVEEVDTAVRYVVPASQTAPIEWNKVTKRSFDNVLKKFQVTVTKTDAETGSPQGDASLAGAVFEVFLKSAGSYENAKETERDVLSCDENGFAQTKDMPYGIYTVRQTSGWEGRELMKDFDVFISKDGQTYRYLINNANFESYIKIVKKDAETGNTIPYAGAGFQICDPNGNLVTMTFTYPEVTTIDTFYTTADGDLITPQTLEYGKSYSLVEVQAPYGYVLNSEPVYFDVVQENSEEESGITVIEVVRSNMAQKGTITVEKSGEVFSSVVGDKGLYQPIFSVSGLEGTALTGVWNGVPALCLLAFLIACPIGVKSKSKSLFLASINSPPCINIIFLLYFTEMRALIERCEIPCNRICYLLPQGIKIPNSKFALK